MESTPKGRDLGKVRERVLALRQVVDVHDLHASLVASGTPVLSAHARAEDGCMRHGHAASIRADLQQWVAEHFDIRLKTAAIRGSAGPSLDCIDHRPMVVPGSRFESFSQMVFRA